MPGLPIYHQLPEFTQTHVLSLWCHTTISSFVIPFSSCLQSCPASGSEKMKNEKMKNSWKNELVLCIRWLKYWSFSFSISPSNEHPGLISFRLDLLAVQGTLKHLLQHHSSKASVLRCSAFFRVQLSHPYMTTGKTIALVPANLVTWIHRVSTRFPLDPN